jgi:hypothetical protein
MLGKPLAYRAPQRCMKIHRYRKPRIRQTSIEAGRGDEVPGMSDGPAEFGERTDKIVLDLSLSSMAAIGPMRNDRILQIV